jgi:hypothetical protein
MKEQLTAVEKIITEIDNELQTLEGLDGKEITGSKIALEFVKKVAIEAKEMEKEQIRKSFSDGAQWELYGCDLTYEERSEEYYNEIFKQEQ